MMLCQAAAAGLLDRQQAILETLTAIKRAGADILITYFAKEALICFMDKPIQNHASRRSDYPSMSAELSTLSSRSRLANTGCFIDTGMYPHFKGAGRLSSLYSDPDRRRADGSRGLLSDP